MLFERALPSMRGGNPLRRDHWNSGDYCYIDANNPATIEYVSGGVESIWAPTNEDLLADDWEIGL